MNSAQSLLYGPRKQGPGPKPIKREGFEAFKAYLRHIEKISPITEAKIALADEYGSSLSYTQLRAKARELVKEEDFINNSPIIQCREEDEAMIVTFSDEHCSQQFIFIDALRSDSGEWEVTGIYTDSSGTIGELVDSRLGIFAYEDSIAYSLIKTYKINELRIEDHRVEKRAK